MNPPFIELPEECTTPPAGYEDAYERTRYDDEKFRLKEGVREYIAELEAELAAAEIEATAALGAERLAHAHTKQMLFDRQISGALESALKANGANRATLAGALALLRKQWQFKIYDDGKSACVISGDAEFTITQAVEHWLAGDSGEAFSTRRPSKTANALTRIQQITRTQ